MTTISNKDKQMIQSLVQSWFNRKNSESQSECPKPESIAAYAFGELDLSDEKLIETHVIDCPKCLAEVVDLREIKAATEIVPKKATSRLLDWAKLADKTRRQIADGIFDKLSSIFPGYTELVLSYAVLRGGEETEEKEIKEVIRLPKQIWHITKTLEEQLSIIETPNRGKSTELQPLADALQKIPFYYFILGLGKDNRLKMISAKMDPVGERHLPIEIDASDIHDTDILWVVIDSDKETMQNIHTQISREINKKRMTIPKIEPFAWVIVFIERKKLIRKKSKSI